MENNNDVFMLGGHEFHSRFILGSGKYNSHLIRAAVEYADAEIVTLALRRANTRPEENILDFIPKNVTLLPNTSGARNAESAQDTSSDDADSGDSCLYRRTGETGGAGIGDILKFFAVVYFHDEYGSGNLLYGRP